MTTDGRQFKKKEEEEIELSFRESIRCIDSEEEEEEDEEEDYAGVFDKIPDYVVEEKVRLVRLEQKTIESKTDWLWGLKGNIRAFEHPKRTLEQYMTPIEDAFAIAFILNGVTTSVKEDSRGQDCE